MKTKITLLVALFLLINAFANNFNTQKFENTSEKGIYLKVNDTLKTKKKRPYHIKRYEASTIKKIGDGNMVIFARNNGNTSFEETIRFKSSSGYQVLNSNKRGFEDVEFPVTISMHSFKKRSHGNPVSKADHITKIFEIEINEPGIWEISFLNGGWSTQSEEKQRGQF